MIDEKMSKEDFFKKYYKPFMDFVNIMDFDNPKTTLSMLTIVLVTQCVGKEVSKDRIMTNINRYYDEAQRLIEEK